MLNIDTQLTHFEQKKKYDFFFLFSCTMTINIVTFRAAHEYLSHVMTKIESNKTNDKWNLSHKQNDHQKYN